MANLFRKDTLIVTATISGIDDSSTVSKVIAHLDTGDTKEVSEPEDVSLNSFEWTPDETLLFPVRRIGVRIIVEMKDGRRFTVAESSFVVDRNFREEEE